ncbi:uncharacterized protein LOC135940526 [Cloeon dipterum]|uniref:uncharacterized protein LOC135940526 n=1 Tax=Cloeon dipterum TaxID=197152 RepID=UPI00322050FF
MTRVLLLLVVLVTIQVVLCSDDSPGLPGSRGLQKKACDGDGSSGVASDYPEGVDPSNRLTKQRNQQNTNGRLQRAGNNNGNGQRNQRQKGNKYPRTTTSTESP